jgi:hypothetical protein
VCFRLHGATDERIKAIRRKLLLGRNHIGQTVYKGKTFLKFTLLNPRVTHQSWTRCWIPSSGHSVLCKKRFLMVRCEA